MTPRGKPGDYLLVNNSAKWWTASGFFSALIRQRTLSNWSHVAVFLTEDKIIEAMPSGVIVRSATVYSSVPWRVRTWREPLDKDEQEIATEWLIQQLGKPYDWTILFGFMFRNRKVSDNGKWFCSEIARGMADRLARYWNTRAQRYTGPELIHAQMKAAGRTLSDDTPQTLTPPSFFAQCEGVLYTSDWQGIKPEGWQ